ncbi:MAG: hypothetical protein QHC40_11135 [Sphingobium sp.]|nr:hypothetical protein [Sphingobium sp.]
MRRAPMTLLPIAGLAACALLAGCGGGDKSGNSVQMKDMEVVDGTATDAMTDLDGVQSEGTATVLPAGNAADNAGTPAPSPTRPAGKAADSDDEVLADQ